MIFNLLKVRRSSGVNIILTKTAGDSDAHKHTHKIKDVKLYEFKENEIQAERPNFSTDVFVQAALKTCF